MEFRQVTRYLFAAGVVSALFASATAAKAGAFQLWEQDAAGIGDYHAGGAAQADSASTEWYNPAGMTRIKNQQLSVGGAGVLLNGRFTGTVTTDFNPAGSTGSSQGGTASFVPNLHYVAPVGDRWAVGFGVVVPFGLETKYADSSAAAEAATKTQVQVIDLTPTVAFKMNRYFSLGAGPDFQYLTGDFDNALVQEGRAFDTNSGHDWAVGFHAGLLFQLTDQTRFGVAYHSQVVHHMHGTSKITTPDQTFESDNLKLRITLPAYTLLSFYHDFNDRWALMGTAAYTQWAVFQSLTLMNIATIDPVFPTTAKIPQNFNNSWNFALGAHYKLSQKWTLQLGGGFDQTPTNNTDRNIRLPDNNHYAVAAGAMYQATQNLKLAGGMIHLFLDKTPINNTNNLAGENITQVGSVKSDVNIIGLQLIWDIT